MKKTMLTVLVTILVSISVSAQMPGQVKIQVHDLTTKEDKLSVVTAMEKEITSISNNASSEKSKKKRFTSIQKITKSIQDKFPVKGMSETGIIINEATYIVLKNATIIDGVSDIGKKGTLFIKDDKIETIDYSNNRQVPKGAIIYNLEGKYIIPGLIDGHTHVTHGTLKEAQEKLYTALKNGVTSVRELGGDGRMLTLLKKNMQIGEDIGPDIFFSTIIAGSEFFDNDPRPASVAKGAKAGQASWQTAITHKSDLRQVIAEAKGLGATAIKVYMSVGNKLFKKVVKEAKRQKLMVWSHAVVPPTKALDITNGGSQVLSHAADMIPYEFLEGDVKSRYSMSRKEVRAYRKELAAIKWDANSFEVKRLFNAMKNNNSILDATLFIYYYSSRKMRKMKPEELGKEDLFRAVRIAHNMGVKIGAGTDHMISKGYIINIHKEIELLTIAGLSNIEALRSATIINAEAMGEKKNIGTIENGKLANLLVLNANPLEDITQTKNIKFVIKRGKVID